MEQGLRLLPARAEGYAALDLSTPGTIYTQVVSPPPGRLSLWSCAHGTVGDVTTHSFSLDDFREAISAARTAAAGKVLFTLSPEADTQRAIGSPSLVGFGIIVNTVGPGPINTELFQKVNPESIPATQKIIASVPLRRFGIPEKNAGTVAFLLTKESGFVTGQARYLCRGLSNGAAI